MCACVRVCVCVRVRVPVGVTTWEFRLDQDSNGGECTCFGAAMKPISDFSYTSNAAFMYRCYNGQLYGRGKAPENKAKVRACVCPCVSV